ncbi:cysteine-rich CWC family protein [Rhizobacter sp. P5_C2]
MDALPADSDDGSTCPRCERAFHCGVNDDQPCWCSRMVLSAGMLARLRSAYDRCLCGNCLIELSQAADLDAQIERNPSRRQ